METQVYYIHVDANWPNSGPNYANNGYHFYKIIMGKNNINIYQAPHDFSWRNDDKLPSDDKFTCHITSLNGSIFTDKDDKISLDVLSDNIYISDYYRDIIHKRLSPCTTRHISYYYNYYYMIKFLVDMKILNKREYLSNQDMIKMSNDYTETINSMIEQNNEHDDNYKEIINVLQEQTSKLEQKHSEMKNYFQNKVKNLNISNDELEKQNSLLKREIKITRLANISNEIKILQKFTDEVLDKEIYLIDQLNNNDKTVTDKIELSNKIKILRELHDELNEKIRVLNVKIDPTKTAYNGELAGTDCYICDDYCHPSCSCDCHTDNDSEKEAPITVKKFEFKGKKYKLSSDNTLYDWDNDEPIGIWNPKTNKIDELPSDVSDE